MLLKAITAEVEIIQGMLRQERSARGDLTPALAEKCDSLIEWVAHLCKKDRCLPVKLVARLRALQSLRYFKRLYLLSPCRRPLVVTLTRHVRRAPATFPF